MKIRLTAPVRHDMKDLKSGTYLDLPKDQALRLIELDVAEAVTDQQKLTPYVETANKASAGDGGDDGNGNGDGDITINLPLAPLGQMTKEELEIELAGLGIEYREDASKTALMALVKQHRQP